MTEREIASEFVEVLKANNVKSVSFHRLMAEIEIALIKFIKYDHVTKSSLADALGVNRTTLGEKMKRFKISI